MPLSYNSRAVDLHRLRDRWDGLMLAGVVHRARQGEERLPLRLVVRRWPQAGCPGARAWMRCALPSCEPSRGGDGRCAVPAWVALAKPIALF